MAKLTFQPNPRVRQLFDDLERYKEFCVDFGYKYDEASLYDMRNYVYRQHSKQLQGKEPRYNWVEPQFKSRY